MNKLFYLLVFTLFLTSCNSDDPITVKGNYDKGVFVVNEGNFGSGTGTLTFAGDDDIITQQVFEKENSGAVVGNLAQSMIFFNYKYYILVNNANKIIVTDINLKVIGEITGLFFPRFMVAKGDKGYVSQWGENNLEGSVAVIDLNTLTIIKNIPTGNGPENLLLDGNMLIVPNGGSYNATTFENQPDSTVAIIDLKTEIVITKIQVKYNPNSVVKVANGYAVSCAEKSYASGDGNLYFINKSNNTAIPISGAKVEAATNYGKLRRIDDNQLLAVYNSFDAQIINLDNASSSVISRTSLGVAYSVAYDEIRSQIYVADAKNFSQSGEVRVYSKTGHAIRNFNAGIIPSGFCFR